MTLSAKVASLGQLCEQGDFVSASRQAPEWDDLLDHMAEFRWTSKNEPGLRDLVGIACIRSFLDRALKTPHLKVQDAILNRFNSHLVPQETRLANQLFGVVQLNRADRFRAEKNWASAEKIIRSLQPPMLTLGPKLGALVSAAHGLLWLERGYLQLAGNHLVPACRYILPRAEVFGHHISSLTATALLRLCLWDLDKVVHIAQCDPSKLIDSALVGELTGIRESALMDFGPTPHICDEEAVWARYYLPAYRPLDTV